MTDLDLSTADLSTKEKIAQAAIRVFTRKGFDGTKTRDIAEVAGINVATLHYHHKSKEELFAVVAKSAMEEFIQVFNGAFHPALSLEEKVYTFVNGFTELFRRKPHLATFCLVESERNPEAFKHIVDFRVAYTIMEQQLTELQGQGKIRRMSASSFITALVGMTIYPFITKGSVLYSSEFDEARYHAFLDEQKQMVPAMILGYLLVRN